jgi:hypothetical protein
MSSCVPRDESPLDELRLLSPEDCPALATDAELPPA